MLAIITSGLSVMLIDIAFEDYTTSNQANFLSSLEEFQIRIKEWSPLVQLRALKMERTICVFAAL